jgi:hypothetical protein
MAARAARMLSCSVAMLQHRVCTYAFVHCSYCVVPASPSLPLPSLLKTFQHFANVSLRQHRHDFSLVTNSVAPLTARPMRTISNAGGRKHIRNTFSIITVGLILSNN